MSTATLAPERIDAFQRIEFNIYNGNFDALRQKGTW